MLRFNSKFRCPVCGNHQGSRPRCWGFLSNDGLYARCTRKEHGGGLLREEFTEAFAHYLGDTGCNCGKTHDGSEAATHAQPAEEHPRENGDAKRMIQMIIDGCDPGDRARLTAYLRCRGVKRTVPPYCLRYHPNLGYYDEDHQHLADYPAMVAEFTRIDGEIVSLLRTYLASDGPGKAQVPQAKKMTPAVRERATRGAAIRLSPIETIEEKIVLTEGIETGLAVLEATGTPTWATGSAVGLEHVVVPDRVRIVEIWADNDTSGTGQQAAHRLAARMTADGRKAYVITPATPDTDWLDVLNTSGEIALTIARIDIEPFSMSADAATSARFRVLHVRDLKSLKSPERLAGQVLYAGEFGVLVAPSGGGKTFVALDIALSVAAGQPWLNRPVRRGSVVYIAAEGAPGLRKRVIAWERHREVGVDEHPIHFITDPVNLLHNDEVDDMVAAIATLPEKPVLVVIDTLARSMAGGDENSAKDMGAAIGAVGRLQQEFGCAVLLTHHTGHTNQDRERGSSALRAAVDTLIVGTKNDDVVTLRCEKMRNAEPFEDIAVRLVPVDVGGEQTCVVERSDATTGQSRDGTLKAVDARALRILVDIYGDDEGVAYSRWHAATGIAGTTFDRVIARLKNGGFVEKNKGRYVATAKGRAAVTPDHPQDTPTGANGGKPSNPQSPPTPKRGGGAGVRPEEDSEGFDPEDPEVVDGVANAGETIH